MQDTKRGAVAYIVSPSSCDMRRKWGESAVAAGPLFCVFLFFKIDGLLNLLCGETLQNPYFISKFTPRLAPITPRTKKTDVGRSDLNGHDPKKTIRPPKNLNARNQRLYNVHIVNHGI